METSGGVDVARTFRHQFRRVLGPNSLGAAVSRKRTEQTVFQAETGWW